MTLIRDCRWCFAAYPILADEECPHLNDPRIGDLARAFAVVCQNPDPSDEQIGWFVEDADAVIDDFPAETTSWTVTGPVPPSEDESFALDFTLTINGEAYVVQQSEGEPAHPVKRSTWESWIEEADR